MMKFLFTTFLCFTSFVTIADEGMWLPSLIGKQIPNMQAKGFKLSAKDVYDINNASLKDAIVQFGGGCTGELISNEGLLLTNHHCAYSQIQNHSSVQNDLLTNGFWAMSREQELPNPGLTVSFLVRMDDVTEQILEGTQSLSDSVRLKIVKERSKSVAKKAENNGEYKTSVKPFYYGNQYFLFVYEVYKDVRLVIAPPSSIGKFGGDTDNWMWPRHTGDFSMLRVYANKDNKPAEYSKENVPFRPKKHFKISLDGVEEGDFTFVYGFPGRTTEYITSDAVDYIVNFSNPSKIALRTLRLDIINEAQSKDVETRIKYSSKNASIANAWKKWQGESKGILRLKTVDRKRAEEAKFQKWASDKQEYNEVLPRMRELYKERHDYAFAVDYYNEAVLAIEVMKFVDMLKSPKVTAEKRKLNIPKFYKDYIQSIDIDIAKVLLTEYMANVKPEFIPSKFLSDLKQHNNSIDLYVEDIFKRSKMTTVEGYESLIKEGLEGDPIVELYSQFHTMYNETIKPKSDDLNDKITKLYSVYMKGMMEMSPNRNFYPDANSTLRIAYGNVAGYSPEDGVYHRPQSTLDGIIEKDNPNIYDYNIPQSLRNLYKTKDYGQWGRNGSVNVAFIATNHTSGGNSGSPVLNAEGNLIGLNFDRTWLSTMSDVEFDPQICRNIAVDIRFVLFIIDKVGGASYLLNEMTLIGGHDSLKIPVLR